MVNGVKERVRVTKQPLAALYTWPTTQGQQMHDFTLTSEHLPNNMKYKETIPADNQQSVM